MDATADCRKCINRQNERCVEESEEIHVVCDRPGGEDKHSIECLEHRVYNKKLEIEQLNKQVEQLIKQIKILDTTKIIIEHPLCCDVDKSTCGYILDISGNW